MSTLESQSLDQDFGVPKFGPKELMALVNKALEDGPDLHKALRYLKMSQELEDSEKIQKRIKRVKEAIAAEAESSGMFKVKLSLKVFKSRTI